MTIQESVLGASSSDDLHWESIEWTPVKASVRRLQMRIAKAVREKKPGKVKALQWILTHSYHAKLLAVKRISDSQGAETPGIDGKVCESPYQKSQLVKTLKRRGYEAAPLRRVYIPKKNHQYRALGIPTTRDRAMQALYLLALEPVSELKADPNAYGFRPERCAMDAIEQCFRVFSHKGSAQWILEGDIRKCFDTIDHHWLIDNIRVHHHMDLV